MGEQQRANDIGDEIISCPTVVDGTVFVTDEYTLYAFDAGIDGSSEGSRVMLGTLGHHGGWRYADQSLTTAPDLKLPLLGGGAATLLGGYKLLQYRGESSSESTESDG